MRTVRETSAGGVIYRIQRGQIQTALIRVRKRWRLPKGHVEEGERIGQTAVREVREETGLQGRLDQKLGNISYTYRAKTKEGEPIRISKRVYFFLLQYLRGDVRNHDYEVDEARWFPIEQAIENLSFATEKRMVRKALSILTHRYARAAGAEVGGAPQK
jgi:8-oxo-dGTP pyrophosphatase MutT (NUDIX family)